MQFEDLLTKVRSVASKVDVPERDSLAVQVNLTGDGSGVFYVEMRKGGVSVEPGAHDEHDCVITMAAMSFERMMEGKLDPMLGFTLGVLRVEGNMAKALEFSRLIRCA